MRKLVTAGLLGLIVGCGSNEISTTQRACDTPFPNITLEDINPHSQSYGRNINVEEFFADQDSNTLVNYWGTTCGPCLEEMPALQRLYESGFPILGIAPDGYNAFPNHEREIIASQRVQDTIEQVRFPLLGNSSENQKVITSLARISPRTDEGAIQMAFPSSVIVNQYNCIEEFFQGSRSYQELEEKIK